MNKLTSTTSIFFPDKRITQADYYIEMLKIGLTGGIGSGKSVVSRHFSLLGVPIIDTDIIARTLVKPGTENLQSIVDHFGKLMLNKDGSLNRKKLAQTVFAQRPQRKKLERLLHPNIKTEIHRQLKEIQSASIPSPLTSSALVSSQKGTGAQANYVIIVIPLLFENHLEAMVDKTLLVYADEQQRIERIKRRDQRNLDEIKQIIHTQVDSSDIFEKADDVLVNNNDLAQLYHLIDALHLKYSNLNR